MVPDGQGTTISYSTMNYSNKIIPLLRKCYLTSLKEYIKTIALLFLPICMLLFVSLLQSKISVSKYDDLLTHETMPVASLDLLEYSEIKKIFYSTNRSKFVDALMSTVSQKLFLDDSVVGYSNEEELLSINSNVLQDKRYLAVIFEHEGDDIPNHLNYTIRSAEKYKTSQLKPEIIVPGPHEQYGQIYERFVTIQIAIDTTFIEMKSGKNVTRNLFIQPFPYPPFKKNESQSIKYNAILPFVLVNCFLFVAIIITGDIIKEIKSGIKELMAMMGINRSIICETYYLYYLVYCTFISIVMAALLILGPYPLLPESNYFIIWFSIFLHINFIILFSIMLSTIFTEGLVASIVIMSIWIATQIIYVITTANYVTLICPNIPLFWMIKLIAIFELEEVGLTFDTIRTVPASFPVNFVTILCCLLGQSLMCTLIILFMEEIRLGPLDLMKLLARSCKKYINQTSPAVSSPLLEKEYFEEPLHGVEIGIKVDNVSKIFSFWDGYKKVALSHVTLDIYEGGITALLGHNGAGKTTLLSIITGMLSSTEGNVYLNNVNSKTHRGSVLNHIGICPQNNVAFSDLTVEENIIFFAMVKGYSLNEAKKDTIGVMKRLNLSDKKNEYCCKLSGGALRRLQLAMALAGRSSILILDEPTTGLDPKNRREIWDILLELRQNHTILLTTHFMEEADVLGDHIAILDHGELKCYGTSMYLKNKICPGYKLTILKDKEFEPQITPDFITEKLENYSTFFELRTVTSHKIEFTIETNNTYGIGKFFTDCEENLKENGILSMGLSLPSMEDIFLKICNNDTSHHQDSPDTFESDTGDDIQRSKLPLCLVQLFALLNKKILYHRYKWYSWVIPVTILILLCVTGLFFTADTKKSINVAIKLDMGLYNNTKQHILFATSNNSIDEIHLKDVFKVENIKFENVKSAYKGLMSSAKADNSRYYSNLPIALSLKNNDFNALYSTSIFHTLPVALNLLTNIVAADMLGVNYSPYIDVYNDPINEESHLKKLNFSTRSPESQMIMGVLYSLGWIIFLSALISYPMEEVLCGTRDLLYVTGVPRYLNLFSYYIYDCLFCILGFIFIYFVTLLDPLKICAPELFAPLFTSMFISKIASLTFIYAMSYVLKSHSSNFIYFFINSFLSCILGLYTYIQTITDDKSVVFAILPIFFPMINLSTSFFNTFFIVQERFICIHNEAMKTINMSTYDTLCCGRDEITGECLGLMNFYTDTNFGILKIILNSSVDKMDLMTIKNVSKTYTRIHIKKYPRRDTVTAIKSMNLKVKQGECFGLIGLNGAGKSTTFKILAGLENPSTGQTYIHGEKKSSENILTIGYCPQQESFGEYLTAKQALNIFCILRNVKNREKIIDKALKGFGLDKLADVQSIYYSGGCKRALSLAVAMIGLESHNGNVLLLDEPTSGVDPFSRKLIHQRIIEAMNTGRSIIISSHSMWECEKLCDRLGIMIDGELPYVDMAEKLKKDNDVGYIISIKLKTPKNISGDEVDGGPFLDNGLNELKKEMIENLDSTMQDEHKCQLLFNVKDRNILYGKLFNQMENILTRYKDCIDFYNIYDTSLEDVFLNCVENFKNLDPRTQTGSA